MSHIRDCLPSILLAFFSESTLIPNFYIAYEIPRIPTLSSLHMTFQFICLEVLVMLSFMFPRLGSREKGFFEIFIYKRETNVKSIQRPLSLTIDFLRMFMSLAM